MSINWRNLHGNQFLQSLHPGMLTKAGYEIERKILPLDYKQGQDKELTTVHYDREFVIEKIVKLVIKPLNIQNKAVLNKLIDESWEYWQENDL